MTNLCLPNSDLGDTGVLFFAYKNSLVDYRLLANHATSLVHRFLRLPVCVVTNDAEYPFQADRVVVDPGPPAKSSRYFHDYQQGAAWFNAGRDRALELSPFRWTLMLDTDYLVLGPTLLKYVGPGRELLVPRAMFDLGNDYRKTLTPMTNTGQPVYWAAVMSWDRESPVARRFFHLWSHVRQHWEHYVGVFGLGSGSLYRNDYAVTIALSILHGHTWSRDYDMPYTVLNLKNKSRLADVRQAKDGYLDVLVYPGDTRAKRISGYDVHIMNKKDLEEQIRHV